MKKLSRKIPWFVLLLLSLTVLLAYHSLAATPFNSPHNPHHDAHMVMTKLAPGKPGDQARAAAVLAGAKKAAQRFANYRDAQDDGYTVFLPEQKQAVYHFIRVGAGPINGGPFDPSKPPALLYTKNKGKGYTFVGVMYMAPPAADEETLNNLVPLSIARWHEHVNLCVPPNPDQDGKWLLHDPRFGLTGSITSAEACQAAGGKFHPHLAGWMTHVYPLEKDPAKIWAAGMDDMHLLEQAMPGMKM